MPAHEKPSQPGTQKHSQPEIISPEVEHLLDVLTQIEKRRQLRLHTSARERKENHATPEIPS